MFTYAKAWIGAAIAGLTSIGVSLDNGSLTARDYVTAAIAVLVAFSGVAVVTNKPTK